MAKKRFYDGRGEDAVETRKTYGHAMEARQKNAIDKGMNHDSGMIKEDWSEPCLLPRHIIDRDWPRAMNYMKNGEADLFMGVQKQMSEDARDMRKAVGPKKY